MTETQPFENGQTYLVENGPNLFDLMTGLFVGHVEDRIPVTFTLKLKQNTEPIKLRAHVRGVTRAGDRDRWHIVCWGPHNQVFEGNYWSTTRDGTFKVRQP